jgi:VRR-NUC domain
VSAGEQMLLAERMSEDDLQANVVDAVRKLGGLAYHTHDSRRSAEGFPDLVIVFERSGSLLFAELKRQHETLTDAQRRWLRALAAGGRYAYEWRPLDWLNGTILRTLANMARAR